VLQYVPLQLVEHPPQRVSSSLGAANASILAKEALDKLSLFEFIFTLNAATAAIAKMAIPPIILFFIF
jgi:hypothetical protein